MIISIITSQCELVPENNCQTVTHLVPELVPKYLLVPYDHHSLDPRTLSTCFFSQDHHSLDPKTLPHPSMIQAH